MKPSFRDVLCGFFSARGVGPSEDALFQEALDEFSYFPGGRTLREHRNPNGVIYTDSVVDDVHADEDFFSVFVGYASGLSKAPEKKRDLARFFSKKDWRKSDFHEFIDSRFAGAIMDRRTNTLRLVTDVFGKRKIFYKRLGDVLFFSTELQVLFRIPDSIERLNRQALRDYLTYGTIIGPETISTSVFTVPLQSYVEFDGRTLLSKPLPSSEKINGDRRAPEPSEVYERFKDVLSFLSGDLGLKFSDLTGGADTRLTLKAALDLKIDLAYNCVHQDLEKGSSDDFDFQVMKLLTDEFQLSTEFAFSDYRSNYRHCKSPFETHRHYAGDIYNDCLSGMFGGELLGGWGLNHFFSAEKMREASTLDQKVLAAFPEGFFDRTIPYERRLADLIARTNYADPKILLSVFFLYSGCLNDRNNEAVWLESYLLSARKISAFLGDAVLRSLNANGMADRLLNYRFYMDVYKFSAPDMLRFPFHSGFCDFFPDLLQNIQREPGPTFEPARDPDAAAPSPEDQPIAGRIKQLKQYLERSLPQASFKDGIPDL
ncbi:MAG TPA: hypothetical protein PL182_07530 [Pseudobdellovibrionaceae bacterium]|nr:hypothetical protein [Pseudobdellovibrionaceae bacterium]